MKIRCGSHQQNRSIVRPGLSLMATKVALTAEEFRENSQRSIDLFNTEKLSTDSTHVRKKCILQFCAFLPLQSARGVWRQRRAALYGDGVTHVAICTGRVEAKMYTYVLRQVAVCCNLHGACGGKGGFHAVAGHGIQVAICTGRVEAKGSLQRLIQQPEVAICTGRVEAKYSAASLYGRTIELQSARGVWRQRMFSVAMPN